MFGGSTAVGQQMLL